MSATTEAPLRVLLVEDNPNDALVLRKRLVGAETAFLPDDIQLEHVETLDAAADVWEGSSVDLVLLDLGLETTSGIETFERARERMPSVPIIVLTGLEDESAAVELLKLGAQDYINKGSLSEENLVKSVRYALERQEREQKLRTTGEQLEVLNRILRHDVRNDIQVLQLWGEHLLESVPEEHTEDVQKIIQTTTHISELTANSKEYIEAITEGSDTETEPVRLDRLLGGELQKARSVHTDATFEAPDPLPTTTVDANGMLASVFRNLLNNAVQHNRGMATVEVTLSVDEDTAQVTVADDGPGVPPDQREEIFGKGDRGLESEGTGIGLYLVHTLVSEFDGRVWVEDRADGEEGAAFRVELPVEEQSTETAPTDTPAEVAPQDGPEGN